MDDLNIMKWYLEGVANGKGYNQTEEIILRGLKIIHFEKGIMRCKLVITDPDSGEDGIRTAGVMDVISGNVATSLGHGFHLTEEVEIEGRVTKSEGNLRAVLISNRDLIATGSLLMAPTSIDLQGLFSAFNQTKP